MLKIACLTLMTVAALPAQTSTPAATSSVPASPDAVACDHALIRQATGTESLLTDSPQRTVSMKHVRGEKTVVLESLGKTGAGMVGGPAAGIAMPYVETGAAKVAHWGKGLLTRLFGINPLCVVAIYPVDEL